VAVTCQTEGAGVFNPDQRLSRNEAGKLADLILVDRDPLSCPDDRLAGTRVIWTMVAGRIVFRAP
jgi:hypothetical protein